MSNAQAYCRNKTTNQNTEERLTNGSEAGVKWGGRLGAQTSDWQADRVCESG